VIELDVDAATVTIDELAEEARHRDGVRHVEEHLMADREHFGGVAVVWPVVAASRLVFV
jgi:hypothetical protein